jgi:type VII secretion-associated serine protease mycosin
LTDGAGLVVAVVDTGVDGAHPQLRGHVLPGYDVLTGGTADSDCQGHGTFVAGIIAAQRVDGVGFTGVAPGVTILPIRETTTTSVQVADLAAGIRAAAQRGAKVINISTTTSTDDPTLRAAVNQALAAGVVVVAASGNDADQGNAAQYPAGYPGVLAVGAVDKDGKRAGFSGTASVGVVAPGVDLISTGAGGTGLVATGTSGGGTSFAAPYVAGVAALVLAYHPGLSPAQVVHRIETTADHPAATLPDTQLGWGVVDPYAAVTAVLPDEAGEPVATRTAAGVAPAVLAGQVSHPGSTVAYGLAAAAVLIVLFGLAVSFVWRRGRARGWRPASRPEQASAPWRAEPR